MRKSRISFLVVLLGWVLFFALWIGVNKSDASDTLYLPNLGTAVQGTDVSGAKSMNTYVTGGALTFTEQATAANGAALPSALKVAAGYDGSAVRVLKTDSSGNLQTGRTWSLLNTTDSVNAVQSGTWSIGRTWNLSSGSDSVSAVQSGTWTTARSWSLSSGTDSVTVQGGNTTAVKVDGSAVTQPISAASLPLPTGASTSANQTNGSQKAQVVDGSGNVLPSADVASRASFHKITDGTNTAAVKPSSTQASILDPALVVSVSPNSPLPTGNNTIGKVVAFDTAPVNVNASNGNSTVTTTPSTLSAPANAVGFLLQNLQTSTSNIRWQIGGAASSSSGAQLAPGQDSGFIPAGSNVSIASESGTQNYSIQWVSQ
jgi:hypothetical protein